MPVIKILVDPDKDYEIVEDPAVLVARYNASEPNKNYHITVQDQKDINLMFLENGILVEMTIQ